MSADARTESAAVPNGLDVTARDVENLPTHQRRRREGIVQAALELLEEGEEYERIQMRDVAERAGVALGTLYRYFTSKEHLYAAVLLEWSETFRLRSERGDSRAQSDEARLRGRLHRTVRAFERHPQFLRAEIQLESSNDANARKLFQAFADRHQRVMAAALRDVDPPRAAAVIEATSAVMAVRLRSWALGRASIREVHDAVDRAVDLIFSTSSAKRR